MYEQLDIFSFDPQEEHITFNPIEEFAKHGSGFVDGKKRIVNFFSENENLTDRVNFLKKEYGIGGFSMACRKPFTIYRGESNAKGCFCQYYNENMENIKVEITYAELAKTISKMVADNRYMEKFVWLKGDNTR